MVNVHELVFIAELRPAAYPGLSATGLVSKTMLLDSIRPTVRTNSTKAELILGKCIYVKEGPNEVQALLEFNAERRSWDYSWKSNRWIVDETHVIDIIVLQESRASKENMIVLSHCPSSTFTIFSARHKKEEVVDGEEVPTRRKKDSSSSKITSAARLAAAIKDQSIPLSGSVSSSLVSSSSSSLPSSSSRHYSPSSSSSSSGLARASAGSIDADARGGAPHTHVLDTAQFLPPAMSLSKMDKKTKKRKKSSSDHFHDNDSEQHAHAEAVSSSKIKITPTTAPHTHTIPVAHANVCRFVSIPTLVKDMQLVSINKLI